MVFGKDIEEFRKTFPSVCKSVDDTAFLILGQFPDYLRRKQEIKHQKLLTDYKNKIYNEMSKIPKEDVSSPDLSILGPSLDSSKFFIENNTLRNMFAKVAASSVDKRLNNYSRSAFVEFIKQLSPLDIKLLYIFKSTFKVNTENNSSNNISIPMVNAIPLIDVIIKSPNMQNYHKRNVVPDEICNELDCSLNEIASSIDNLSRMGIIKIRNNRLVNWRFKSSSEWFKKNRAISSAYESINKERSNIEHNIYLQNHHTEEVKFENGHKVKYRYMHSFADLTDNKTLEEKLDIVNNKHVLVDYNKMIELTSLGSDFSKVCM